MTSFQVECFLTVARFLNFTEAANHLFVAQSSLSRNVSNLEKELGFALFTRTKKSVRLTPAGAVLYTEFSRIRDDIKDVVTLAKNAETGQSGTLRLGIIETQRSDQFLPAAMSSLSKNHPNIHVDISTGNFKSLREDILNNRLDIALTMGFDLSDYPLDQIVSQDFYEIEARIAISKRHPFAKRKMLSMPEMESETLIAISPDISHGAYNEIIQLCDACGFTPQHIQTAKTISDLMLKVESGQGYAILDANCISNSYEGIANIPVRKAGKQSVVAVWRRNNINSIIPIFMNILTSVKV